MEKSKYKYVSRVLLGSHNQYERWQAQFILENGKKWKKTCKTEHQAAMSVDLKLIEVGKEPVNILKRK